VYVGRIGEVPHVPSIPAARHHRHTGWFNVGTRIGYAARRIPDVQDVVRYHDEAAGTGRVPKLQEWFSLVGNAGQLFAAGQWAYVVTYPGRTTEETERLAKKLRFQAQAETAAVHIAIDATQESITLHADFNRSEVSLNHAVP
jgi:hypothetical protein